MTMPPSTRLGSPVVLPFLLALGLALFHPATALANGGGVILTPPPDLLDIPAESIHIQMSGTAVRFGGWDGLGHLWAATQDSGLACRRSGSAQWQRFGPDQGLPDTTITAMEIHDGALWLGFPAAGVMRQRPPTGSDVKLDLEPIPEVPTTPGPPAPVLALLSFRGTLWVASESGLWTCTKDQTQLTKVVPTTNGPQGHPTTLSIGGDGALWVGTDAAEICRFDGQTWTRHDVRGRTAGKILRALCAFDEFVWIGTYGSLCAFTPSSGRLDDETAEKPAIFPTRIITALMRRGPWLIVGTGGAGLYRMHVSTHSWRLYTGKNGFASTTVNSVVPAPGGILVSGSEGLVSVDLPSLGEEAPLPSAAAPPASAGAPPLASPEPSMPAPTASPSMAARPVETESTLSAAQRRDMGARLFSDPSVLGPEASAKGISCATCHPGGRAAESFDGGAQGPGVIDLAGPWLGPRLDDGRREPRRIPDLLGISDRSPYSASGRFPSLREWLRHEIVVLLGGAEPSARSLDALEEHLATFERPRPPDLVSPAGLLNVGAPVEALRGEALFWKPRPRLGGRACATCHDPRTGFMDRRTHDRDGKSLRTPSLLGIKGRTLFWHDGHLKGLAAVVDHYETMGSLGLTTAEKADLVRYLEAIGEVPKQ